jgi:hypothetical protein
MKIIILSILIILVFSCNKETKVAEYPCKYTVGTSIDSSLFISFKMNGLSNIFYQRFEPNFGGSNSNLISEGKIISNYSYLVEFDDIGWNGDRNGYDSHPYVVLSFIDTTMFEESNFELPIIEPLFNKIRQNYQFIIPNPAKVRRELIAEDTMFFKGVSIAINKIGYSTSDLITSFNYNRDSLHKYLWAESYLRIIKSEIVCNNLKIIEGEFSTTVSKDYSVFSRIDNGRFRIVIK